MKCCINISTTTKLSADEVRVKAILRLKFTTTQHWIDVFRTPLLTRALRHRATIGAQSDFESKDSKLSICVAEEVMHHLIQVIGDTGRVGGKKVGLPRAPPQRLNAML